MKPPTMIAHASHVIEGHVSPGFETVRDAFMENFARRGEAGGACCAWVGGKNVVDLWGGVRDADTGAPWERDTMVVIHSATKGLAAMTLAIAHSRGWLDYDARVATYWPEFAQHGKHDITVRQLLAHQAGLFAFDEPVDRSVVADLDRLAAVMARHRPAWEPSCCAVSIHAIAASGSSFRTRSRRRLARKCTSGFLKRSRTHDSRRCRPPAG
jgi:CubicO group peptidase (beta-lactamase class C family)